MGSVFYQKSISTGFLAYRCNMYVNTVSYLWTCISHGHEGLSENRIESIHLTETEFVS